VPSTKTAQELLKPAETETALEIPETVTGTKESVAVPLPSCP
jgi:hypothetical protein